MSLGHFEQRGINTWSDDGENFRRLDDDSFVRPVEVGGDRITFLKHGTSDGASRPWVLEAFGITRAGRGVWIPAFGHDNLYRGRVLVNGVPALLPKDVCDLIYFEMLVADGLSLDKAREYYNGVCEGGQHAFDEDRAALAAQGRTT